MPHSTPSQIASCCLSSVLCTLCPSLCALSTLRAVLWAVCCVPAPESLTSAESSTSWRNGTERMGAHTRWAVRPAAQGWKVCRTSVTAMAWTHWALLVSFHEQYTTVHSCAVPYSEVQCNTVHCNTVQCSTALLVSLFCTTRYCTVLYCTVLYCAAASLRLRAGFLCSAGCIHI